MPKGSKVHRCVQRLKSENLNRGTASAIKICQASTGQAYATGKSPKRKRK